MHTNTLPTPPPTLHYYTALAIYSVFTVNRWRMLHTVVSSAYLLNSQYAVVLIKRLFYVNTWVKFLYSIVCVCVCAHVHVYVLVWFLVWTWLSSTSLSSSGCCWLILKDCVFSGTSLQTTRILNRRENIPTSPRMGKWWKFIDCQSMFVIYLSVCLQLTSAWWIKGGEALVVAYSDGTLITFDTKTGKMKKDILNITS